MPPLEIPKRRLLDPTQIRWLGALLLAVQLPQAIHMAGWVAVLGIVLVVGRVMVERRGVAVRDRVLASIPSYVLALFALGIAVGLRQTYGIFIGRDPCVAFLFILAGIKYFEARTLRDGTLLVCLASFLVVTLFFYDQSLLAAAAVVPALVLLVCTLQMLAPPGEIKQEFRLRDPVRRSVRLLIEGVPLALLLFVLFPRLPAPLWGLPSDVMARTGLSDRMRPGSISDLSLSDAVAFRVDFSGPMPPPQARYWRGPVFTRFDGAEWSPGPVQPLGRAVLAHNAPAVLYTVTLEPHYRTSLFALDFPAGLPRSIDPSLDESASVVGRLTADEQLIARAPVTQALRYAQISTLLDAFPAQRGFAGELERRNNLQLPRGNARTLAWAEDLRRSHPDDAGLIAAVLAWFRDEEFFYTLHPPALGANPVDAFLFDTRRGFCEHYASAFVVLLRAAGIPARVVTGYQGGEVNPNGGYLIVRQSDAHAWAEALLDGQWRRFDPTAAVAPNRIELGLGAALPADQAVALFPGLEYGWLKRMQLAWDALNYGWRRSVVGFNAAQQQSLWRYWSLGRFAPWQVVLGVSVVTALWAAGLLLWFELRHRQRDDKVVLVWNALCNRLGRAGLPREPHEGPLAYCARATARWPGFAAAFAVIGGTYAELRYGRNAGAHPEHDRALARLRHAVAVLPGPWALRNSGTGA